MTYEHTMLAATALSYVAGIVGNKKVKPWIERLRPLRIPVGRAAVWLVGVTWWAAPVYAVASYATLRICDAAALRLNDAPEGCPDLSAGVAKTLSVTRFETGHKNMPFEKPALTAADFEDGDPLLDGAEIEKIQRFVLMGHSDYYAIKDEARRAKIWNGAVRHMKLDKKYLRDESEIVAEDARN